MTLSPISLWIRQVFEHSLLSKETWAASLGTRLATVSQYLSGDLVPDARTLRALVLILQDHESQEARRCCELWHELAQRPIHEVYPSARTDAPTLAHYLLGPLWEDHRIAIAALPAHEQEQLLLTGICEATRWTITRNRAEAGLPMVLCDDDIWGEEREERKEAQADGRMPLAAALPAEPPRAPIEAAPRVAAEPAEVILVTPSDEPPLQLPAPRAARGSTPTMARLAPPAAQEIPAIEVRAASRDAGPSTARGTTPPPEARPAPRTRQAMLRAWVPLFDRLPAKSDPAIEPRSTREGASEPETSTRRSAEAALGRAATSTGEPE